MELLEHLKLSYADDVNKLLIEIDPTKYLLRYMYMLSNGSLRLSEEQRQALIDDIYSIKKLNKWDVSREKHLLEQFQKRDKFITGLDALPLGERYKYLDQLRKEFNLCLI